MNLNFNSHMWWDSTELKEEKEQNQQNSSYFSATLMLSFSSESCNIAHWTG